MTLQNGIYHMSDYSKSDNRKMANYLLASIGKPLLKPPKGEIDIERDLGIKISEFDELNPGEQTELVMARLEMIPNLPVEQRNELLNRLYKKHYPAESHEFIQVDDDSPDSDEDDSPVNDDDDKQNDILAKVAKNIDLFPDDKKPSQYQNKNQSSEDISNDIEAELQYQAILEQDKLGDLDPDENCDLKFVIDKILECEAISVLFGRPGSGKSTLAASEIVSIASGKDLLNLDPDIQEGKVAVYWSDEGRKALTRKIRAVCEHHGLDVRKVFSNIKTVGDFSRTLTTENIDQVERAWSEILTGVTCLYADSLSTLAPDIETSNTDASIVLKCLEKVAKKTGIAIRLIHHPRKGPPGQKQVAGMDEARGASSLTGRSAIVEQTIGKYDEDSARRFLAIGGKGTDLKYRNTPRPAQRHYEVIGVKIDDSKYQPTIVIPHEPGDDGPKLSLRTEYEYLDALRIVFEHVKYYPQDKQSPKWIGAALAKHFDIDIAHSAKNDKQRSETQISHRKRFDSDLTILVSSGHIVAEQIDYKTGSGNTRWQKVYVPGKYLYKSIDDDFDL